MTDDVIPLQDFNATDNGWRIVRRSHGLRTLGLALGAIMVGTVLRRLGAPPSVWVMLAAYTLVWPQVAWLVLRRSAKPGEVDKRLFMGDAAMGGVWIALMQFNLLPSLVLATMYAITLIAVEDRWILARGLGLMALTCCVAAVANGLSFAPDTGPLEVLASAPLLVVFPVTLSTVTRGLARRVRAQNQQLLRISSTDCMSGLLNRSHWEAAVDAALVRHCCDDAVMLMIDIDHFKRVNDQYGHTTGDEVVRKIGSIIHGSLRDGDLAGRYGGDEFALVLCGADMHAAATVAERIRSTAACSLFERAPGLRCTLSIGLSPAPATRATREWVKAADGALYRAKLAGRNRFVVVG